MKLLLMSDLHGTLPDPSTMPDSDIAVVSGDIVPAWPQHSSWTSDGLLEQVRFVHERFIPWLLDIPATHVALTWGNHDGFADQPGGSLVPQGWWPDNVHVLVNEAVTLDGLNVYGIPQTPRFHDWSFNEDDTPDALGKRWQAVPDGTDILISHGPPRGTVDWIGRERVGSKTMERWLKGESANKPNLVVCGHIHAAGGNTGTCGSSTIMNVAMANERYNQVRKPVLVDWETL